MAKKATRNKNKKPIQPSLFEDLSPHTKQAITAVVLIVFGVLFLLAYFDKAGPAGEYLKLGLSWLFGYGYFLAPLLCFSFAFVFLRPRDDESVSPAKVIGVSLLYVALLGFVTLMRDAAATFNESGGALGYVITKPLIMTIGDLASGILLSALLLSGIFLIFDTGFVYPEFLKRRQREEDDDVEVSMPAIQEQLPDEDSGDAGEEKEDRPKQKKLMEKVAEKVTAKKEDALSIQDQFIMGEYKRPPISLLKKDSGRAQVGDVKANANIIKRTLKNFRIPVEMDEVSIGPSVTRYAIKPAEGVRLSKIVGLQNNLELALAASPVRIEAPIPGKSLVGIEVPNTTKSMVGLASLLGSPQYTDSPHPLMVALGRDITGSAHFANLAKMPHTLVAGTTGSGKSVTIHALITSLLFRNPPELLRLILVDPKRVELTLYNGIPHLLTPVIIDPKKAIIALKWAINEMTRRYDVLQAEKVRDVSSYHKNVYTKAKDEWIKRGSPEEEKDELPEPLPYIVIIIDELADLMQSFPRELESSIVRLAQMSRAVGIHLVLSTQRPSVNVVTGLIKANIPSRIALQVASQVDSKTILDQVGAEKLLGQGDMLFLSGELSKPTRLQSAFVSEEEVKKVVGYLKKMTEAYELDSINLGDQEENGSDAVFSSMALDEDVEDDLYNDARAAVIEAGKASTSYLQRKLRIGYGRAARLMDILEDKGVIGPADGSKPREILSGNSDSKTPTSDEEA